MIECKTCGAEYYPGTLFCRECGAFLQDEQWENRSPATDRRIHYLISKSGRQGEFECKRPVWIGRADPEQGYWPQLDLTADGAADLGVSRKHALIKWDDDGLVLIDQHSKNGTWLNQEQLIPEKPYPLPQQARIKFGHLLLLTFLE